MSCASLSCCYVADVNLGHVTCQAAIIADETGAAKTLRAGALSSFVSAVGSDDAAACVAYIYISYHDSSPDVAGDMLVQHKRKASDVTATPLIRLLHARLPPLGLLLAGCLIQRRRVSAKRC